MLKLTPTQMGSSIANSLTGYIAHIPGSVSCRHCELAQEIADAFRAVKQETWEEAKKIVASYKPVYPGLHTPNELATMGAIQAIVDEFRRRATGGTP